MVLGDVDCSLRSKRAVVAEEVEVDRVLERKRSRRSRVCSRGWAIGIVSVVVMVVGDGCLGIDPGRVCLCAWREAV